MCCVVFGSCVMWVDVIIVILICHVSNVMCHLCVCNFCVNMSKSPVICCLWICLFFVMVNVLFSMDVITLFFCLLSLCCCCCCCCCCCGCGRLAAVVVVV